MPKYEIEVEITTVERKKLQIHAESVAEVRVLDHHLGVGWSRGNRTYRPIGEPVELTDEVLFEKCIPAVGSWELFSSRTGWLHTAERLNNRLRAAFKRIQAKPAGKVREALKAERKKLYEAMGKEPYVKYGASDSEPRNCADDAFEKFAREVLGLDVEFSYGEMIDG